MSKFTPLVQLSPKQLSIHPSSGSVSSHTSAPLSLVSYCPSPTDSLCLNQPRLSFSSQEVQEAEVDLEEAGTGKQSSLCISEWVPSSDASVAEKDAYERFSEELRLTKAELSQLYRENKLLHKKLESQEELISKLNAVYKDQTRTLRSELNELKAAALSRHKGYSPDEDWQTKPTFETEEYTAPLERRNTCCSII